MTTEPRSHSLESPGRDAAAAEEAAMRHLLRLLTSPVAHSVNSAQEQALRGCIEPGWQESASCASADPEAWFPVKGDSAQPAVAVCAGCPVGRSCLATALLFAEDGIWAGTHYRERRTVLAALRRGADAVQAVDQLAARVEQRRLAPRRSRRWSGKARPESGPEAA